MVATAVAEVATAAEGAALFAREFNDTTSLCSWSPFNQYWILQARPVTPRSPRLALRMAVILCPVARSSVCCIPPPACAFHMRRAWPHGCVAQCSWCKRWGHKKKDCQKGGKKGKKKGAGRGGGGDHGKNQGPGAGGSGGGNNASMIEDNKEEKKQKGPTPPFAARFARERSRRRRWSAAVRRSARARSRGLVR